MLAFVLGTLPGLAWLGLAALLAAAALSAGANWATVGIDLDASRRWVTLSGVHPDFVAAVRAEGARERADLQFRPRPLSNGVHLVWLTRQRTEGDEREAAGAVDSGPCPRPPSPATVR
ncbi:hypothetical protein BH24ACT2_BH24ACT2_10760 [soil metagenome]